MRFVLTSPFGGLEEFRGKPHTGIDMNLPEGTELRSIFDGTVERIVDYGSQNIGKGVIIRLEEKENLYAIYGHMSKIGGGIKVGDKINVGDSIGFSGSTGFSTGAHLHFGLYDSTKGEYVDPTQFAETIDKFSGEIDMSDSAWWDIAGKVDLAIESAKEEMKESFKEMIFEFLKALGEVTLELMSAISLIGGGVLILLRVVGYQDGKKWFGLLMLIRVFVSAILGGVS